MLLAGRSIHNACACARGSCLLEAITSIQRPTCRMSFTREFCVVPNAWRFGDYVPDATDWRTLGGMQAGRLDSGSEVIWHGDVRLQTFKPYRQVAIFEDLQLWRSPSNSQLLLYKAPKLTLVLNVEMVTGTRILLLNLSNMAGNSVMELDFPWTVKLTGKYLRKQAVVSLRMRSILRCSQELKLTGKHGEILDQKVILKPGNVSKLYQAHKKRLRTKTDMRRLSVNL